MTWLSLVALAVLVAVIGVSWRMSKDNEQELLCIEIEPLPSTAEEAQQLHRYLQRVPLVRSWLAGGGCARVRKLSGGLSNINYRVDLGDVHDKEKREGGSYLLRVAGDAAYLEAGGSNPYETAHQINRRMEQRVAEICGDRLNTSPKLLWYDAPLSLSAFLEGRTLDPAELREPKTLLALLALLDRFHADSASSGAAREAVQELLVDWPAAPRYRPLDRCRARADFLRSKPDCRVVLPEQLDRVFEAAANVVALLDASFAASGRPTSFVHSDVNTANLMRDSAEGRMWLLDFEYASVGDSLWDLGSIASLNTFDEAEIEMLVDAFLSDVAPPNLFGSVEASKELLRAHVQLMRWLTDLQEAMWGYAQHEITHLSFESTWASDSSFQAYGDRLFSPLLQQFESGRVESWSLLVRTSIQ